MTNCQGGGIEIRVGEPVIGRLQVWIPWLVQKSLEGKLTQAHLPSLSFDPLWAYEQGS